MKLPHLIWLIWLSGFVCGAIVFGFRPSPWRFTGLLALIPYYFLVGALYKAKNEEVFRTR